MLEEKYRESFFDATNIFFAQLQLNDKVNNVAEFGCGCGTFTIPATKIIKGILRAFDIDEVMISRFTRGQVKICCTCAEQGG